jgi:hypothetical protein
MKCLWNRTMLNLCGFVVAILKMATGRNFSMSGINSGHPSQYRTNSTLSDFNAISYVGRLWCPELIPDIEKFLPVAIFKMATTKPHKFNIVRFQIRDITIYTHMKWHWNRTMLNLCGIVTTILKMATGRNFSMTGINSGHHYLLTYQILMISDNVEFLRYCGGHFENSRHRKISTGCHFQNGHHKTAQIQHCPISKTFHMWVNYDVPNWFPTSKNFYRSPFTKWPPQYHKNSTLFDFKGSFWFIF